MKIAAVTQDGETISSHFGMAPQYNIFNVENGAIASQEIREKPHHSRHPDHHEHGGHGHGHGHGQHGAMFAPVEDCQVLLCGGMGTPAYEKALASGLEVVMTGGKILDAVQAYLDGHISSDLHRIHQHR